MTALKQRKTRLTFETGCEVRERGAYRTVVIETASEFSAFVRLKGTRTRYAFDWASVYGMAVKQFVSQQRAEKAAARKAKRGGR
jgi:hypothetical protein